MRRLLDSHSWCRDIVYRNPLKVLLGLSSIAAAGIAWGVWRVVEIGDINYFGPGEEVLQMVRGYEQSSASVETVLNAAVFFTLCLGFLAAHNHRNNTDRLDLAVNSDDLSEEAALLLRPQDRPRSEQDRLVKVMEGLSSIYVKLELCLHRCSLPMFLLSFAGLVILFIEIFSRYVSMEKDFSGIYGPGKEVFDRLKVDLQMAAIVDQNISGSFVALSLCNKIVRRWMRQCKIQKVDRLVRKPVAVGVGRPVPSWLLRCHGYPTLFFFMMLVCLQGVNIGFRVFRYRQLFSVTFVGRGAEVLNQFLQLQAPSIIAEGVSTSIMLFSLKDDLLEAHKQAEESYDAMQRANEVPEDHEQEAGPECFDAL